MGKSDWPRLRAVCNGRGVPPATRGCISIKNEILPSRIRLNQLAAHCRVKTVALVLFGRKPKLLSESRRVLHQWRIKDNFPPFFSWLDFCSLLLLGGKFSPESVTNSRLVQTLRPFHSWPAFAFLEKAFISPSPPHSWFSLALSSFYTSLVSLLFSSLIWRNSSTVCGHIAAIGYQRLPPHSLSLSLSLGLQIGLPFHPRQTLEASLPTNDILLLLLRFCLPFLLSRVCDHQIRHQILGITREALQHQRFADLLFPRHLFFRFFFGFFLLPASISLSSPDI